MAHPHAEHMQHKVEKSRVASITKGYARGGFVHSDAPQDRSLVKRLVKPAALKADGGAVKARADRPSRKRGGRVNKGATVNVIVGAPQGEAAAPAPMPPMAALPPPVPRPMMPPPGGPPMPPPSPVPGMGPMPPRSAGGRTYARGGRVGVNKGSAVYEAGVKAGTQVSHDPGKNDLKDMGRGKPITYKTGGAVEHPLRGGLAPHLPGGAGGGKARLAKERMAKR